MGRLRLAVTVAVVLAVGALVGSAVSQYATRPAPPVVTEPFTGLEGRRIRVEVLNAGGVAGVARAATEHLRERSFDVVFFGNAEEFDRERSAVLARNDDLVAARAVADALGIRNVLSEPDSNLYLDVSVLLGRDWAPPAADASGEDAPPRPWWDPRGWLRR